MPSIRKRVYGLIRTTFSPNQSVDDDCVVDEEEEAPSTPTTEQHSFIHQYLSGRLKRTGVPEIYFGKTGLDLPVLNIEPLETKIRASYTGPDGGLTEVPPVRKRPIANIANLDDELSLSFEGDAASAASTLCGGQGRCDSVLDSLTALPHGLVNSLSETYNNVSSIGGRINWCESAERAFGLSTSLYESNPLTSVRAGEPVADVFGVVARENSCVLALADGVNWGERARLAAQCAVRGALEHVNEQLLLLGTSTGAHQPHTTLDMFHILLGAFHAAHQLILQEGGQLTTLCCAIVVKLLTPSADDVAQWAVCACNVGDSLCFVYSPQSGVREVTLGSHDIGEMRDMRDAGGALGPVDGVNPELQNLTCSMTFVEQGDVVFITSDGVSDNFDPVVGKFCVTKQCALYRRVTAEKENSPATVAQPNNDSVKHSVTPSPFREPSQASTGSSVSNHLPLVEARQRHELMLLRMDDLLRHGVTVGDDACRSAAELCQLLVNFATQLTMVKRRILEDPDLYGGGGEVKLSRHDQKQRRRLVRQKISEMPGKLDHATVVAYTVGVWKERAPETLSVHTVQDIETTPVFCPRQVEPLQNGFHAETNGAGCKTPDVESPITSVTANVEIWQRRDEHDEYACSSCVVHDRQQEEVYEEFLQVVQVPLDAVEEHSSPPLVRAPLAVVSGEFDLSPAKVPSENNLAAVEANVVVQPTWIQLDPFSPSKDEALMGRYFGDGERVRMIDEYSQSGSISSNLRLLPTTTSCSPATVSETEPTLEQTTELGDDSPLSRQRLTLDLAGLATASDLDVNCSIDNDVSDETPSAPLTQESFVVSPREVLEIRQEFNEDGELVLNVCSEIVNDDAGVGASFAEPILTATLLSFNGTTNETEVVESPVTENPLDRKTMDLHTRDVSGKDSGKMTTLNSSYYYACSSGIMGYRGGDDLQLTESAPCTARESALTANTCVQPPMSARLTAPSAAKPPAGLPAAALVSTNADNSERSKPARKKHARGSVGRHTLSSMDIGWIRRLVPGRLSTRNRQPATEIAPTEELVSPTDSCSPRKSQPLGAFKGRLRSLGASLSKQQPTAATLVDSTPAASATAAVQPADDYGGVYIGGAMPLAQPPRPPRAAMMITPSRSDTRISSRTASFSKIQSYV